MTVSVEHSWQHIVNWLHAHAPATARDVEPPATEEQIAAMQGELALDLPTDLIALWRLANGLGLPGGSGRLIPPGYTPLSISEALRFWRYWQDSGSTTARDNAEAAPAGSMAGWFLPVFVPIAAYGTGDYLFVDLREGPRRGCVQEWNRDDGCLYAPWWASVGEMLAEIAEALLAERAAATGTASAYVVGVTEEGAIEWHRPSR